MQVKLLHNMYCGPEKGVIVAGTTFTQDDIPEELQDDVVNRPHLFEITGEEEATEGAAPKRRKK